MTNAAAHLGARLGRRTVAVAESCTGGLITSALAAEPGSGVWFRGALVAYQRDVKFELLRVTPGPVVSTRAAAEMAIGVAALLHADVAVAVTGAAGPDPHDGAQPGTVIIAVAVDGETTVREYFFAGPPSAVLEKACTHALRDLGNSLVARSGVNESRTAPRRA